VNEPQSDIRSHKAGYVNIIGKPNVGKSTLMNRLAGERLSIITSKAQTTRHRIMGILNGENFQVVYSDTPGIIKPEYELHRSMMQFVHASLEDADILLFMAELFQSFKSEEISSILGRTRAKIIFILNKTDLGKKSDIDQRLAYWKEAWKFDSMFAVSALKGTHTDEIFAKILELLPEHPPYFPKDQLTDRPERFFAAEIVREKIFLQYSKEIPYSSEVAITAFREDEKIIRMRAEIFVERQSQKGILIGKGGEALKQVGIMARKDLEIFFGKQVYLEQFVRVEKDWRKRKNSLAKFGF
jgi:GTPase